MHRMLLRRVAHMKIVEVSGGVGRGELCLYVLLGVCLFVGGCVSNVPPCGASSCNVSSRSVSSRNVPPCSSAAPAPCSSAASAPCSSAAPASCSSSASCSSAAYVVDRSKGWCR